MQVMTIDTITSIHKTYWTTSCTRCINTTIL